MRNFVRDFLLALAAIAIPMLLVGWIAGLMPSSTQGTSSSILALAPLYVAYLVPVALLVLGLRHRRLGLIAGTAAFGAVTYGWVGASILSQIGSIQAWEVPAPVRSAPGQGLIALSTTRECDRLCVQLIASGRYNVAIRDWKGWWVWSRLQGSACETEEMKIARVRFLRAGYPNMCMQHTAVPDIANALVLAEYRLAGDGVREDDKDLYRDQDGLPGVAHPVRNEDSEINRMAAGIPGFVGTVYELSERRSGADTVLARRFSGHVSSAADRIAFSLLPGPVRIGTESDRIAFYEAATGLSLTLADIAGPAGVREIFDRAEQELMKSDLVSDLSGGDKRLALAETFGRAAGDMSKKDPALVRERVERFLAGESPLLTHAGLLALYYEPERDLPFIKERLLALMESDDPAIASIAVRRARGAFELADDPAIKRGILEIAFRNELFETESVLTKGVAAYAEYVRYESFEEPIRSRARSFLLEEEGIAYEQCKALFRIFGANARPSDSIDVFVALPTTTFATCAGELKRIRRPNDAPVEARLTGTQVDALMARAKGLDAKKLADLWRGIALTDDDSERAAPAMLDLISALRHEAEQDPDSNKGVLALLHKLEQDLSN